MFDKLIATKDFLKHIQSSCTIGWKNLSFLTNNCLTRIGLCNIWCLFNMADSINYEIKVVFGTKKISVMYVLLMYSVLMLYVLKFVIYNSLPGDNSKILNINKSLAFRFCSKKYIFYFDPF
jgi:hypothetical protein